MVTHLEKRIGIIKYIDCDSEKFIEVKDLVEKTRFHPQTIRSALGQETGRHCFEELRGIGYKRTSSPCPLETGGECLFIS